MCIEEHKFYMKTNNDSLDNETCSRRERAENPGNNIISFDGIVIEKKESDKI